MPRTSGVFASLPISIAGALLVLATPGQHLFAGQEAVVRLSYLVKTAHLVAVVRVTEVTRVDVSTGQGQLTSVYVAQGVVEQHIKPDDRPHQSNRTIAIVGSTVPRSSAVWKLIAKKRYLAFLTRQQGHFHYGLNMAFRELDAQGSVVWYEHEEGRPTKFGRVPVQQAIQRIQEVQQELATQANIPQEIPVAD